MDNLTIFTWTMACFSVAGAFLNSRQNKYGFLIWGVCNIFWLLIDFAYGIYAQSALYFVFLGLNVYGWNQWKKKNSS